MLKAVFYLVLKYKNISSYIFFKHIHVSVCRPLKPEPIELEHELSFVLRLDLKFDVTSGVRSSTS